MPTNTNFVVPAGITQIAVVIHGASGGGGGGHTATLSGGGGGGGGGGRSKGMITVTPGETLIRSAGTAGAAGAAGSNGGDGEGSSLKRGATVLMSANGGSGGVKGTQFAGGTGGVGATTGTGYASEAGQNGSNGTVSTGGAGGNTGNTTQSTIGGTGGATNAAGIIGQTGRVDLFYLNPNLDSPVINTIVNSVINNIDVVPTVVTKVTRSQATDFQNSNVTAMNTWAPAQFPNLTITLNRYTGIDPGDGSSITVTEAVQDVIYYTAADGTNTFAVLVKYVDPTGNIFSGWTHGKLAGGVKYDISTGIYRFIFNNPLLGQLDFTNPPVTPVPSTTVPTPAQP